MYFSPFLQPLSVPASAKVPPASVAKNADSSDESEPEGESDEEEVIPNNLSDNEEEEEIDAPPSKKAKKSSGAPESTVSKLLTEKVERRTSLPPLLSRLNEREPEKLNYIGVSFGATPKLLRFWKKAGYLPVYLRQVMVSSMKMNSNLDMNHIFRLSTNINTLSLVRGF